MYHIKIISFLQTICVSINNLISKATEGLTLNRTLAKKRLSL